MEQQDYIYDVFLSYRRAPPVGDWVKNHFYPLGEHFPPEAEQTQQRDLSKWRISAPAFAETKGLVELEMEMQSIV